MDSLTETTTLEMAARLKQAVPLTARLAILDHAPMILLARHFIPDSRVDLQAAANVTLTTLKRSETSEDATRNKKKSQLSLKPKRSLETAVLQTSIWQSRILSHAVIKMPSTIISSINACATIKRSTKMDFANFA